MSLLRPVVSNREEWREAVMRLSLHESAVGLAVAVLILMVDSYHGFMGDDDRLVSSDKFMQG